MPRTPDRYPGEREEEQITLLAEGADPTTAGAMRYVGGDLRFRDSVGVFNPREGSISSEDHRVLDQLTHDLDEDYFEEYTYTGWKPTNVTVWTSVGKTLKIREYDYTWTGVRITLEVAKQYNGAGALVETLTKTYAYTGNKIIDVTVVRS